MDPRCWTDRAAIVCTPWLLSLAASAQDVVLGDVSIRPVLADVGVARALAAGDMDADGRLDVLVGHDEDLIVLLHQTDGTLAGDRYAVGAGMHVTGLATLDWDLDGQLDVAIARDNRRLNVWTGDGAGGLVTQLKPEVDKSSRTFLEVGDMDGDGLTDIALGQGDPDELHILLNDGTEDGKASLITPLTHDAWDLALGDLDADGDLDVVSIDILRARWWLSDGSGALTFGGNLSLVGTPLAVVAAELDGDAASEFVVSVRPFDADHRFKVLGTQPDGSLKLVQDLELTGDFEVLVAADGQGDGLDELYAGANPQFGLPHGPVRLWRPTGHGGLSGPESLDTDLRVASLLVADLRGDGAHDLFVGLDPESEDPERPDRLLVRHRGDGVGGFLGPSASEDGASSSLAATHVIDLDGDGLLDVVAPRGPGGLYVFGGEGHLQWSEPLYLSTYVDVNEATVADLDGDGLGDMVLAQNNDGDRGLSVFLGDGTLDPPQTWHWPSPFGSSQTLVQDMGADGDLDILDVWPMQLDPTRLRVIAQQDGRFEPIEHMAIVQGELLGGDLDGDGSADVLTVQFDGSLKTLLGTPGVDSLGHGPLGQVPIAEVEHRDAQLADLDGDGDLDLAIPGKAGFGNETREIHLLTNDGTGAFLPADVLPTPHVFDLDLADLDGDGAPEIVYPKDGDMIVRRGSVGAAWDEARYWAAVGDMVDLDGDGRPEALSAYQVLTSTPHGRSTWFDVDGGVAGGPRLVATGELVSRGQLQLRWSGATPGGVVWTVVGLAPLGAPQAGGLLVPRPDVIVPLPVDRDGALQLDLTLPAATLTGVPVWLQPWTADGGLTPGDGLYGLTL